jgi:uncharacterized protein YdaU (DUF1376 family)
MAEDPRPAPYPADTLAKGWRFEVDMEKVKRSDTWLRAKTGEVRGALLLLWGEAWQQTPCGTLPPDDELVALIIDMPAAKFAKHRNVLMRGWWLAEDGRLYHETITERVLAMLEKRAKDAKRSADRRERQAASTHAPSGVTPASRVTHAGDPGEFGTKHQAPDTRKENPPKPPRKRRGDDAAASTVGLEVLVAEGIGEQHAKDWLTVRKTKRLPLTPTAWDDVKAEAQLAGLTLDQAIHTAVVKSWGGFKAKWLAQEAADDAARAATRPDGQRTDWWETKTGLLDKGLQLSIPAPADEHPNAWLQFKANVWVAAGDGPWWDKTSAAYPIALRMRDQGNAVAATVLAGIVKGVPHAR